MLIALMGMLGTTALTEMTGIILAGIFLFSVLVWLYKEDAFDPVQSLKESDALEAGEEAKRLEKMCIRDRYRTAMISSGGIRLSKKTRKNLLSRLTGTARMAWYMRLPLIRSTALA